MSSQSTSGKTGRLQGQTNRSIRVESSRIVDIFYPPSRPAYRVLIKCLANRLPVRRVDCRANESIHSSRIESNRRHFLPSLKAGLPCFYEVSSQSTSNKTGRLQGETNRSSRVKSSRIVDSFYLPSRPAYRVLAKCLANRLPVRRVDCRANESVDPSRVDCKANESIESSRIVDIFYPPSRLACRVFTKCLANRLPVRRVDCKANESIDSSRIESNRRHFVPSYKAGLPCFY